MEQKYVVINFFTDLRDYDHPYNVGDEFPRRGVTVSGERIAELSSGRNKQRRPLIKAVSSSDFQEPKEPETPDPPMQSGNPEPAATPENTEPVATPDNSGNGGKYSKEDIEALKLPQIRELAGRLGFKISSTSKDGAVVEFLEKQG